MHTSWYKTLHYALLSKARVPFTDTRVVAVKLIPETVFFAIVVFVSNDSRLSLRVAVFSSFPNIIQLRFCLCTYKWTIACFLSQGWMFAALVWTPGHSQDGKLRNRLRDTTIFLRYLTTLLSVSPSNIIDSQVQFFLQDRTSAALVPTLKPLPDGKSPEMRACQSPRVHLRSMSKEERDPRTHWPAGRQSPGVRSHSANAL